jgi:hypothetical protein
MDCILIYFCMRLKQCIISVSCNIDFYLSRALNVNMAIVLTCLVLNVEYV